MGSELQDSLEIHGYEYESEMPLQWVYYPEYEPWISFSERRKGDYYLCECSREAVKRWLSSQEPERHVLPKGEDSVLGYFVPKTSLRARNWDEMEKCGIFQKGVCHICAGHVPARRKDGEGCILRKYYSWYVDQALLAARGDVSQAECSVLSRFGVRRTDRFGMEEMLFLFAKGACRGLDVKHQAHLEVLRGLELDVWIPQLKVGLEYQGIQHYEAQNHWGGEAALIGVRERDNRKRQACEEHGIVLLEFRYDKRLDDYSVYRRLLWAQLIRDVTIDEIDIPDIRIRPSGPEWVRLNGRQKLGVLLELWVFEQMERKHIDQGVSRLKAAARVSMDFARRWPHFAGRTMGVAKTSIYNRYVKWQKLKRALMWQDGLKYRGLIVDKNSALESVGLTEEIARAFLRSWRYGVVGWAREHDVKREDVEALFKNDRRGSRDVAAMILKSMCLRERELLKDIREVKGNIKTIRMEERKLECRLNRLNRDLDMVTKRR